MTDATDDASEGDGLGIILLVVLIDMLGFSLVIPFLTYFIQDLASGSGFEGPSIDLWVGVTFAPTVSLNSCSRRCWAPSPIASGGARS